MCKAAAPHGGGRSVGPSGLHSALGAFLPQQQDEAEDAPGKGVRDQRNLSERVMMTQGCSQESAKRNGGRDVGHGASQGDPGVRKQFILRRKRAGKKSDTGSFIYSNHVYRGHAATQFSFGCIEK